jgi:hypothetical protein
MDVITQFGQKGYDQHFNTILNADAQWKKVLLDDKNGKIINNVGTLRHEDHQRIMDQLVTIRRRSLNGIADLQSFGLTSPESIGTQLVGTENINEFQPAKRDMNPTSLQDNVTDFALSYTPLPITHQSWRIPFRQLGFGYKRSVGLSESVRQVSESLEQMLFNGAPEIQVSTNGVPSTIIGYTTAPNRSTAVIGDWTVAVNILPGALLMVGKIFTEGATSRPNSCILYVANNVWTEMQNDYVTDFAAAGSSKTAQERVEAISEISQVKPAEFLADGEAMLVEMEDRTVELSMASDIVTIPHIRTSDIDDQVFTTYAVMVPILKSDRNDRMGIVHGTPT